MKRVMEVGTRVELSLEGREQGEGRGKGVTEGEVVSQGKGEGRAERRKGEARKM